MAYRVEGAFYPRVKGGILGWRVSFYPIIGSLYPRGVTLKHSHAACTVEKDEAAKLLLFYGHMAKVEKILIDMGSKISIILTPMNSF